MPQRTMPDTYLRLDASSYHAPSFFTREREMAETFGMDYHTIHFSKDGASALPTLRAEAKICLATNTHTPVEQIPQSILEQTQVLLHANSGYDNFPAQWVKEQSFPIILGNEIRAQAVTQYILTQLFSHFNQVTRHYQWDKSRKWDRPLMDRQEILIIGYGEIGKKLESVLRPLSQKVTLYDPYQGQKMDFDEGLPFFDIILFACSLNNSSRHLLHHSNINKLKPNALIINAARGPLIEEAALISFLKNNPQAFAILDVFEKEPFEEQFSATENIMTTSHIAGVSSDLDQRIIDFAKKSISAFIKDSPLTLLQKRYLNYDGKGILI